MGQGTEEGCVRTGTQRGVLRGVLRRQDESDTVACSGKILSWARLPTSRSVRVKDQAGGNVGDRSGIGRRSTGDLQLSAVWLANVPLVHSPRNEQRLYFRGSCTFLRSGCRGNFLGDALDGGRSL